MAISNSVIDRELAKFKESTSGTVVVQFVNDDTQKTQTFAYTGVLQEFIGLAAPGSNKGSAVWQIRKLFYTANQLVDIQWASGSATYENIWNDRESLSYS